jgi:dihydrofolate reductase
MPKTKRPSPQRRRLTAFVQLSLDGFFADVEGDIRWAHSATDDPEWEAFVAENAKGGGLLIFGRVTYEMMAGYWGTAEAARNDPVVAREMNRLPKIVFSRTLKQASWLNTKLVKRGLASTVRRLKRESGPDMAILGSGSVVAQLAAEGLIDELQIVVNPVVLGQGRPLFASLGSKLDLKLVKTRSFRNGNVLLCYGPAK